MEIIQSEALHLTHKFTMLRKHILKALRSSVRLIYKISVTAVSKLKPF